MVNWIINADYDCTKFENQNGGAIRIKYKGSSYKVHKNGKRQFIESGSSGKIYMTEIKKWQMKH
jgi:hypothetical protein